MHEVELKFLEIDLKQVIAKLESLGATKIFEGQIIQSYFDSRGKHLRRKGSLLRVRLHGDKTILCFKRGISKDQAKIMDEIEVEVSDYNKLMQILKSIGLVTRRAIKKYRISYTLDNCHIDIDKLSGVPRYLEVESNNLDDLRKGIEKLGLNFSDGKTWSQKEVVDFYQNRNQI